MSKNFKEILSRGDTVGGKQVQNDVVRGQHTPVRNDGEHGRSMVEMLGVLAVIGVLSVGGIAGYTSAMRQYKANEIVNATSMLYMMGASQNQGNGDKQMLYSGALGTVPSGVSEITYNADKTITLAFTDTDVCPLVKNKLGDKATGECPTLTVSFGETTVSEPTIEEDLTEYPGHNGCPEGTKKVQSPLSPPICVKSLAAAKAHCTGERMNETYPGYICDAKYIEEEDEYTCVTCST